MKKGKQIIIPKVATLFSKPLCIIPIQMKHSWTYPTLGMIYLQVD